MKKPDTETQRLLRRWANWRLYGNPYAPQSSIQAFRDGGMGGVFSSKPPLGVEMPEGVGYIVRAMNCAMNPGYGKAADVEVVQEYYLTRQAGIAIKDYIEFKELPESTVYAMRESGERFITGFIAGAKEYEKLIEGTQ